MLRLSKRQCGDKERTTYMSQGKVKWFNPQKGFGFIQPNDGSKDVFVHASSVNGLEFGEGLREGEEVEYEVEQTPKGLSATNVHRIAGERMM